MAELFTINNFMFLLDGLKITCLMTILVSIISLIVGFILALVNFFGSSILKKLTNSYIELFRNTPMLLWIMAVRFLIPIPLFYAGVLAMSLVVSSNIAEDIRGGMNMIPKGQYEAAVSQGFNLSQMLVLIILPQLFRNILPILLSECVSLLKNTSLLWAIGIEDLTGKGMILLSRISDVHIMFALYLLIAGIYFLINSIFTNCIKRIPLKK